MDHLKTTKLEENQRFDILRVFEVLEVLGKGAYSCVLRVIHKKSADKKEFALKVR